MNKNLLTLSLLATFSSAAIANENDIERVIVTGEFRDVSLEQLSASASIIGEARLNNRQVEHLDSMLNVAPNVNFAAGASRGRFIQIRGIGERSQFSEPVNPSVSFFVDDFDFSGLAAAGVLFDTQQVEVFRGPQATLFGTGALAGAVKIVSTQPSDEQSGYAEFRVGNKGTLRAEAANGGAVNDNTQYRVSVMTNRSDGFIENIYLNRDDTAKIDETAARFALTTQLSNSAELNLAYRWYDIDNGYDAFSLDNDSRTRSDEPGFDRQETHAVSANGAVNFDAGQLRIIATYADHDIGYGYDEDWTFVGFHPWEYSSTDHYFRDFQTTTFETRFTSGESARLFDDTTDWTVGFHVKDVDESLLREYTYNDGDFTSEYAPTQISVYAQTETDLTDKLQLVASLRGENFDFDYQNNSGLDVSEDKTMVGGKLALNYFDNNRLWYGSISRGYKGPGVNIDQQVSDEKRFFDAEYNWNYEIGYKGQLWSPELIARVALFHMRRDNTQVNDFDVQTRDDGTPDFIDIIDNADVGTNQGLEVELSWQATDSWNLNFTYGYLDAKFEGFERADGTLVREQRQAQAPRHTANLFSDYTLTDEVSFRIDIDLKDEYRFSDGHDEVSPFTALVNADILWAQDAWEARLWAKNLFDREYYVRGFGGFNNDPREFYETPEPYYQLGNGRQYGVTVRYNF